MKKPHDLVLRAAGFEYRLRGLHEAHGGRGKPAVSVERWKSFCNTHGEFVAMSPVPEQVLEQFEREWGLLVVEVPKGSMPALEKGCPRCQAAKRMLEAA